jgi:cold shock CspA family protein
VAVKDHEDIFFSLDSEYLQTSFEELKVGDKVKIEIRETERGPFAVRISLMQPFNN